MAIGTGVVLLLIGLILALGVVDLPTAWDQHVDSNTLGWIFIVLGVLAIVLSLVLNAQSRRQVTRVEDDRLPPPRY